MDIEKIIIKELAYCFSCSGDNPDELMNKITQLVIKWHLKGKLMISLNCLSHYNMNKI